MKKVLVTTIAWSARLFIKLLSYTLRVEVHGKDEVVRLIKTNEKPLILALWHSRLLLVAPLVRDTLPHIPACMLISKSRDGDIPSRYAETYKDVEVIR
ncbi:MAG TPA: hypothetical protein VN457_01035, partial [Chlamydiales bacterium]|nr:hypothetical protein [Chlamydiales bacterium]